VPKPKAYSYIRMSTAEQAKGDSTRRQNNATNQFAEEHNLELVDILIDEGVSAYTGMNAEFGKLGAFIALAEKGEIDEGSYLIVESLDRISRQNFADAMALLQRIINLGINIVTLSDRQIYSKSLLQSRPNDILIAILTLIRAHEESQIKSMRLKASWENKRELARSGKMTRHVIPKWLTYSECKTLIEPIPERAEIVKEIFNLSCSGWGAYSIAKLLNSKKYKTWGRAKFWQESYIKKILHNRSVMGEYQPHVLHRESHKTARFKIGEPIADYYPAIIDEELFYDAQNSSRQRIVNGKGRKGKYLSNLFSSLIFCHQCGCGMRFINKGPRPKGGTYLRCSNALLSGNCHSNAYSYPKLEKLIIEKLRQLDMGKIKMDGENSEIHSNLIAQKGFLEGKIHSLSDEIDYLLSLRDKTKLDFVAIKLTEANSERDNCIEKLRHVNADISDISIPENDISHQIENMLYGEFQSEDERAIYRRKLSSAIKSIVRKIAIFEDVSVPWEQDAHDANGVKSHINLHIYYKNGASQVWYGADESNLYMPASDKMNLLKQRLAIASRE